ncbi:protein saal1 [Stomoxys calcitrans]|uniref:Beta-catenin-like protein 1 N-terminal domain-containing protein n=1 Tax=Stomoxys calcitrans TaxID=35570 RepID=A0A1I8PEQ7_STOCA|nr:protein saal1 [Stomoxys calcitrans]
MSSSPSTEEKHKDVKSKNDDEAIKAKQQNDEDNQRSETSSFNPTQNDCEEQDLERLKGDAIGDTLYSERFVLNTLLKLGQLSKDLQEEEEDLEKELCSLWDMTMEKDIVEYLLKQDVLELFATIIKTTEDKRLSEILVGILANMVHFSEARSALENEEEIVFVLLELSSCLDSLTLEQLMRLFAEVFVNMEGASIFKWYEYMLKSEQFAQNIAFILTSAVRATLVFQTMEALNAILAKFATMETPSENENKTPSFEEIFVNFTITSATIEALQTLQNDTSSQVDNAYEAIPKILLKANQIFCNIHSILTQYGDLSREAYEECNDEMLATLKVVLKTIDGEVKAWSQYEQTWLESLNDILRVLKNPFDLDIAQCLLKLHFNVSSTIEENLTKDPKANDFESVDDGMEQVEYEQVLAIILNTINFLILKVDKDALKQCISLCPRKYVMKVMDTFQEPIESESLKTCYSKLKDALEEK